MIIVVRNGNASPTNVTLTVVGKVGGLTIGNVVTAVPGTTDMVFGPFQTDLFNNADGVYIDFSLVTTVTLQAFHLP